MQIVSCRLTFIQHLTSKRLLICIASKNYGPQRFNVLRLWGIDPVHQTSPQIARRHKSALGSLYESGSTHYTVCIYVSYILCPVKMSADELAIWIFGDLALSSDINLSRTKDGTGVAKTADVRKHLLACFLVIRRRGNDHESLIHVCLLYRKSLLSTWLARKISCFWPWLGLAKAVIVCSRKIRGRFMENRFHK